MRQTEYVIEAIVECKKILLIHHVVIFNNVARLGYEPNTYDPDCTMADTKEYGC